MSEHPAPAPAAPVPAVPSPAPAGTQTGAALPAPGPAATPDPGLGAAVVPLRGRRATPAERRPTRQAQSTPSLSAAELYELYGRQADELAATVEAALAEEQTYYEQAAAVLAGLHRRRTARLSLLARALGEQHGGLDEAAHLAHRTPAHPTATATGSATATGFAIDLPAPATVFGYRAGDRVRDPRSGCTGRVRIHTLTPTQRAQGHPVAEVVWDGWETPVDLELAVAHGLTHLHHRETPTTRSAHDEQDGQVRR